MGTYGCPGYAAHLIRPPFSGCDEHDTLQMPLAEVEHEDGGQRAVVMFWRHARMEEMRRAA